MRYLIPTFLSVVCALTAMADEIQFSKVVKASLVFRDDFDATRRYPHILKVFLRLDNAHDAFVAVDAGYLAAIASDFLGASGTFVARYHAVTHTVSVALTFRLPNFPSRLDEPDFKH